MSKDISFWLGSYSAPQDSGVYACAFHPDTGFRILRGYPGFTNPSYILPHPSLPVLYSAEETQNGAVHAWRVDPDGISRLGGEATGGADPCHLSLWQDHLFAANYSSGSFAVFSLGGAGEIRERTDLKIHAGHGPNPTRQEGPHAHCCFPWQDFLCVCDLGLDAIFLYGLEEGKLVERTRFQAPAGSGPRHLAAHPAFPSLLYCVTELTGELLVLQPEGAELRLLRRIPMVPDNFDGLNTAAAIHFTENGQSLLVSHRGLDAIAVFPIDARGLPGEPVLSPCVREPRDFMIAGEYVLAGSQKDHVLRAYRLNGTRLAETPWQLPVHSPVCFQPLV